MRRLALAALLVALAPATAQEAKREYIYGGELMTPREREQYRKDVAGAKDPKQVRERHRQRLRERAGKRGVELNEEGVVRK